MFGVEILIKSYVARLRHAYERIRGCMIREHILADPGYDEAEFTLGFIVTPKSMLQYLLAASSRKLNVTMY